MNAGRWRHIAETYAELGMIQEGFSPEAMLYDPDPRPDLRWVYWMLGGLLVLALGALFWVWPLYRLNRRLREADAAKNRYLALLTHEIRTPLSGIVGVADLLRTGPLLPEQQEEVALLDRSAQDLLHLVDNVLEYSRLEAGRLQLERRPVALEAFVSDIIRLHAPAARAKGVVMHWEIQPGVPARILTDPLRLRQILNNLVANAVKFTATGTVQVRVKARPAAAPGLCIQVSDTGPGIPADRLGALFHPFVQADASIARCFGGSGLGLSIARELARLLGGDIAVASVVGQGTTFTVEITAEPLAPETPAQG